MKTDVAYLTSSAEQALVMNGLKEFATQETSDDSNGLWRLARAALATVRGLQTDLHHAQADLIAKQKRIDELEQLATTDELTKIANRRGFFDAFEREMDRTNRGQTIGGLLIMIDMDNFKTINDTYGHAAGDEALKLVALTLSAHIRKMDLAARLGGDEFVLLFSNAERIGSVDRAQKLARKLNSLTLKHDGHRIAIRASIGIQSYAKGDTINTIFQKADERMYKAKAQGKAKAKAEL